MRIGMVAPPWFTVPPSGYGGIERVVSYLTEGLVERGHEVTLFAAGGSRSSANLVETFDAAPSPLLGDPLVEGEHLIEAYSRWREFDIIHDHTRLGILPGIAVPIPVVHTVHGQVTPEVHRLYRRLAGRVHLIAISENQRNTLPDGLDATVIWNAVHLPAFPFEAKPGEYLLFVGRMCPEKGVLEALEIARRSGRRLVLCAKINEVQEQEYFELVVRPALAGVNVELLAQPSPEELGRLYAGALATLFPIQWPEPFGLVMIESMATGTPVIAFRNGSVPEVIDDGVTGRICENVDEAVAAVEQMSALDRTACRQRVRELFSAPVAVARHEALYRKLTGQPISEGPGRDESPGTMGEPLIR
ncbi:MAG: glycosyltransferase family 4 protein [Hyphomicrobiales bacterium]